MSETLHLKELETKKEQTTEIKKRGRRVYLHEDPEDRNRDKSKKYKTKSL